MKIFDMNNLWVIRMIDENFSFFVIGFDKTEAIEKPVSMELRMNFWKGYNKKV